MKEVIIFGNGKFAELIYIYLSEDSSYKPVGFCVDRQYINDNNMFHLPVVPFDEVETKFDPLAHEMIIAIGFQNTNHLRSEKFHSALLKGYNLISYISSRATTFNDLHVGTNCVVLEQAVIHPFVRIGNDVTIASGAMVGHHAVIEDHCFIAPGAIILGGARIGRYSFVGANSCVREKTLVAQCCVIGSGVSVTRNTCEYGIYLPPAPQLAPTTSKKVGKLM